MSYQENRDYLDMTTRTIQAFANDGRLDLGEFNEIVDIALRDQVMDDNEKRVLGNIINRLTPTELTAELQARIHEVRSAHNF